MKSLTSVIKYFMLLTCEESSVLSSAFFSSSELQLSENIKACTVFCVFALYGCVPPKHVAMNTTSRLEVVV